MNAPLMANTSAFEAQSALPMPWVERIFQRLHGRFGNAYTDKFRVGQLDGNGEDIGVLNAKTVWAEELASYTPDEIKVALAARYNYPPSLDEFQKAARPAIDLHAQMLIAIREMGHRRNHQPQAWPSRRLFWTAQRLAHELRTVEQPEKLLKRFELAWYDAANDADKPIPDVAPASALPAPGKTTLSQEEAKKRTEQIGLHMGKMDNTRRWAFDIASNPKRFPVASIEAAIKALKVFGVECTAPLIERAKELGLQHLIAEAE